MKLDKVITPMNEEEKSVWTFLALAMPLGLGAMAGIVILLEAIFL